MGELVKANLLPIYENAISEIIDRPFNPNEFTDDWWNDHVTIPNFQRHEIAEQLIARQGAKIFHHAELRYEDGNKGSYYDPNVDEIHIPVRERFKTEHDYYNTVFHELGHWTGADHRLNRPTLKMSNIELLLGIGNRKRALEEVIADSTSAFVASVLGINLKERHSHYIKHFGIRFEQLDEKDLIFAFSEAAKAANMILGVNE